MKKLLILILLCPFVDVQGQVKADSYFDLIEGAIKVSDAASEYGNTNVILSTDNVIGVAINKRQLFGILSKDVLAYYNLYGKYDTDLKRKVFTSSAEGKELSADLQVKYQILVKQNYYYFQSLKWSSGYNLSKHRFEVMHTIRENDLSINLSNYINFYRICIPMSTNCSVDNDFGRDNSDRIYCHQTINISLRNEKYALDVENNLDDCALLIMFNINKCIVAKTEALRLAASNQGLRAIDAYDDFLLCNTICMYIVNTRTGKIYSDAPAYLPREVITKRQAEALEQERIQEEQRKKEEIEQKKKQQEAEREAKIKEASENRKGQITERTKHYLVNNILQSPSELNWLVVSGNEYKFSKQDSIIGWQTVGYYNNPRIKWTKNADSQQLCDWLNQNYQKLDAKVEVKANKTVVSGNTEVEELLNTSSLFEITPPTIKIEKEVYPCDYNSRPIVIKMQTRDYAEYPKLTLNTVVKQGIVSHVWKYDKKLNIDSAILNVIQKHYNIRGKRVFNVRVKSCSIEGIVNLPNLYCVEVGEEKTNTIMYFYVE